MSNPNTLHRNIGIAVFLVTLGLYIKTMAPTVSFWDCGEFIACSYTIGVPHPPGAPLYVLLGRVFSLLPLGEPAWRVTLMSVVSSALAVWCAYSCIVVLGRRVLGGESLKPFGDGRDVGIILGAAVGALSLAFSYTHWFNATEAEVYGYSIFFVAVGLWLVLYWEGTQHGSSNDRWLYLLAYMFGLGGGIHLLCLLIIPSLMVLAWFADEKLRRLILLLMGLGAWSFVWMAAVPEHSKIFIGLGLLAIFYYLYHNDRRSCWLLLGALLLFGLGYSTYLALYIRSGLNPSIDENDPETWLAFLKFLNREQYGTESQLLTMLTPRADRTYQFWHQQMKYFFQQFPFPFLERGVNFRWATDPSTHHIPISLVPYLLGLGGLIWHAVNDWKRFIAIFAIFMIMGFGLSMYLNMPDPQPRERHYVFGGMYFSFALWIGLGWTGFVEVLRLRANLKGALLVGAACVGLLLPTGIAAKLYHIQDRTGDYIAYDYAYNILQSCEPNGMLFTNGDNDTFPLWFLQEVEGVRRDVRVVNLSLLNTGWYIKQLRDREPVIDIDLSDKHIDSVLTDTQLVDLYKRVWREPRTPREFKEMGLDVMVSAPDRHDLLRVQDIMVIGIIYWNQWRRPIHFALTVAGGNRVGLEPYLRMEGMTMRLEPERDLGADGERLEHNLFNVYQYRSIKDPAVYKDENSSRLLGNYRACVMQLADYYNSIDQSKKIGPLLDWAEQRMDFSWEGYYTASDILREGGEKALAADFLERASNKLVSEYGLTNNAHYDNLLALGSILLSSYDEAEGAERVFRQAIALEPGQWNGYYELAAALQVQGRVRDGYDELVEYRMAYGGVKETLEAERILLEVMNEPVLEEAAAGTTTTQP
jgi:hypothetical protein